MLRHIVLWRFMDYAEGASKEQNLQRAKEMFEALPIRIPEILSLEMGITITEGGQFYDLALNSTFTDTKALLAYQQHPAHLRVVEFLRKVQVSKVVIDYAI